MRNDTMDELVRRLRWLVPLLVVGLILAALSGRFHPASAQGANLCVTFTMRYHDPNQSSFTGAIVNTLVFRDCQTGELYLVGFDWTCPKDQRDYNTGGCKIPVLRPEDNCYLLSNPSVSSLGAPINVVQDGTSQPVYTIRRQVSGVSGFTALGNCSSCPTQPTPALPTRPPLATSTPRPPLNPTAPPGASNYTLQVPARSSWLNTGIWLTAGSRVTIDYVSGLWSPWPGESFGADGTGRSCSTESTAGSIIGGVCHISLIGRVGSGDPFYVGSHASFFAPFSGDLSLGPNDRYVSDNSGALTVSVTVFAPAATSTPVTTSTPWPTNTPQRPTSTPTPTYVPPTFTRVPSTSTPAPRTTVAGLLELNVTPIKQRVSPPILLSNGVADSGTYDCFVASTSMALEYLKSQNVLSADDTTGYRELVPIVRGTTPPNWTLVSDSSFVSNVTHGKVSGRSWYTKPENLAGAMETELKANRPVVVGVPNWNLLAAHWAGAAGHSILVYGLHDGRVYYIDPWDGGRYNMTTQDFVRADSYRDGSFLVTFEVTPR